MKPKEQSWWDLERARLKELYDNCGILIEFERCKAQHEKECKGLCDEIEEVDFLLRKQADKFKKEMQEKKTYCNLCNGEDEATICIWCHKAKTQELKDVPIDLLHTFRCSDAYELGKKETLKEVKELEQKHEKKIESLCKLFDDCVKAKDLCYNQKMQELRRVTDKRVADVIAVTKEKVREETLKEVDDKNSQYSSGNFYRWLKKELGEGK